jgi:hypothetical protein
MSDYSCDQDGLGLNCIKTGAIVALPADGPNVVCSAELFLCQKCYGLYLHGVAAKHTMSPEHIKKLCHVVVVGPYTLESEGHWNRIEGDIQIHPNHRPYLEKWERGLLNYMDTHNLWYKEPKDGSTPESGA